MILLNLPYLGLRVVLSFVNRLKELGKEDNESGLQRLPLLAIPLRLHPTTRIYSLIYWWPSCIPQRETSLEATVQLLNGLNRQTIQVLYATRGWQKKKEIYLHMSVWYTDSRKWKTWLLTARLCSNRNGGRTTPSRTGNVRRSSSISEKK